MGLFTYFPDNTAALDRELDKKIFRHSFIFSFFFIVLFWLVRIFESIFGFDLYRWGILPRHINGLWGILFSPFIHSDYNHLISNTVPFFILLFALVYFYRRLSYRIFFLIYFLSGLCVWLGGRESWHIGASGIVYGLVAFHSVSGIIRNDLRLLIVSAVVIFLYGGLVWGVLPLKPQISWESHLWGAVSGVLLAFYYRRYSLRRRKFDWEEEPDDEEEIPQEEEVKPPDNPDDSGKRSADDWWN